PAWRPAARAPTGVTAAQVAAAVPAVPTASRAQSLLSASGAASTAHAPVASQRLTVRPRKVPPADHFREETSCWKRRAGNPPQGDDSVNARAIPSQTNSLRKSPTPDVIPERAKS